MFNRSSVCGLVAALLTHVSVAQDAQSAVAEASHAIGADAVKNVQSCHHDGRVDELGWS